MWFNGYYCLNSGRSLAILNFGRGGGLVGGCAIGTEQCHRYCRPYQVPPGTIRYPREPCPMYRVPCTVRYRPSCHPVFALPYSGQSQVCVHLHLPYFGTSHLLSGMLCCQVLSGTSSIFPSLFGAKLGTPALVPSLFGDKWASVKVSPDISSGPHMLCLLVFGPSLLGTKSSVSPVCARN